MKSMWACVVRSHFHILLASLFLITVAKGEENAMISEFCWEKEQFTTEVACHICSSHEMLQYTACGDTGYIEQVKCEISGTSIKSCPVDVSREAAVFWKFEGVMVVLSLISGLVVMHRMRKLNQDTIDRIQRQISAL
uniref:Jumping translocation breakpoint protein n=1 Tax=Ciona savignyi TaxID=51511 RepID=H2YCH4_CIOSA